MLIKFSNQKFDTKIIQIYRIFLPGSVKYVRKNIGIKFLISGESRYNPHIENGI